MNPDTEELRSGEKLLALVAYDLPPGDYTVAVVANTDRGSYGATFSLEALPGPVIRARNSWRVLSYLYEASVALDGGYLAIGQAKDHEHGAPSRAWVWQVLANELLPVLDDTAERILRKDFTVTFPCDETLRVETAWVPKRK